MNAAEREPVETRVLNPTASEASYKPKQRSYRTTNLKNTLIIKRVGYVSVLDISAPDISVPALFGAKTFFFRFLVL